ncbi:MFS transporter [Oenococcus sp. UCMA 17063]|nr:MFS transporter [Oenococcus sp. UCMA 17063]
MTLITDKVSDGILIIFMILNGTGFGFMSQTIVSSVRFLPKEKSGIGSGITNSSRQLGTCLGMTIMVAFLNTGINSAKFQTTIYGRSLVKEARVSQPVKNLFNSLLKVAYALNNDKQKSKLIAVIKQTNHLPIPKKGTVSYSSYQSWDLIDNQLARSHIDTLLPIIQKIRLKLNYQRKQQKLLN